MYIYILIIFLFIFLFVFIFSYIQFFEDGFHVFFFKGFDEKNARDS